MPKITFVYPDFENIGVQQLMAVCLQDGYQVDFVYYEAEDPCEGKTLNISFEYIAKKIADTNPNLVAFSCVTVNFPHQLNCARALKAIMPEAKTIFGGIHPTAVPEKVIKRPEVDSVAIGEAEISFLEFLKAGTSGDSFTIPDKPIRGIVFKKEDKIIGEFVEGELADLNTLPTIHKKPFYQAFKYLPDVYMIMTSRGCPYHCSYCFNSHFQFLRGKNIIRQRSVDNVIKELLWAQEELKPKYIFFADDSFTTNAKWIYEFCDRYKKEISLPFSCIANPHYIDSKKAEALSAAGCYYIQIGIQSISEELCREILLRKSSNAKIVDAIRELKRVGIMVSVDHMLGVPGDTLSMQEESVLFYNKTRPNHISVQWLTYYPKTAIIDIVRKQGLLSDEDIKNIEDGLYISRKEVCSGGSMLDPKPFFGIALLLNYLPILPRPLINFLLRSRLHRILRINNYYFSVALPRVIQSIFNKKDLMGRSKIKQVWYKLLKQ